MGADPFSEFTTFPLPPAYSNRVRAALNASAPSVKLSNLVGGTGWWYRFGRRIADVYVSSPSPHCCSRARQERPRQYTRVG